MQNCDFIGLEEIINPFKPRDYIYIYIFFLIVGGGDTQSRSWLRHCVSSQKDEGSIPDGVLGIFLLT